MAAPAPPRLIERGKFGVSVWTHVLLDKFLCGRPSHRLLQDLADWSLKMAPGTLAGGLKALAPLFEPMNQALVAKLRSASHWHADETRWAVFVNIEGKVGRRWQLWVFHSAAVVHYVVDPSRAASVIEDELGPQNSGKDRDSRIFPGHYVPVMVMEHGRRVIKPMRYQCRTAGKPALYDTKYPGTYNARRDNLEGFWKRLFGYTHGIVVINAFYENVNRPRVEGRELGVDEAVENVVLEFKPRPTQNMLVACLWSRWTAPGEPALMSFAAITDEPPAEVAAAGHDRCIIPIRPEHVDAWLNPDPVNLAAQHAILDDRARPFYEQRMAA